MNPNPFKPTAGKRPPMLIGRESVIEDFEEGLDNGAGAPGRLMLITGNRGCGKTVLLRELQRLANERCDVNGVRAVIWPDVGRGGANKG